MSQPALNQLDRDVIESVLLMGSGYVLDFSDRTFSEFFLDFDVPIDDAQFHLDGSSKARRLRAFLRTYSVSQPKLVGTVLGALLERRLLKQPDGLNESEVAHFRSIVRRFGGMPQEAEGHSSATSDRELLERIFQPELLKRLPIEVALSSALAERMAEAHACIEAKAFLAAVILSGSILEGLCLGYGSRTPERVNRAYARRYHKTAPPFERWKLREWIEVLGGLGDLSPNVEKFGHALRDFRNFVHPAEQIAHRFSPDEHTARIGFQVVVAAVSDLVRASSANEESTR